MMELVRREEAEHRAYVENLEFTFALTWFGLLSGLACFGIPLAPTRFFMFIASCSLVVQLLLMTLTAMRIASIRTVMILLSFFYFCAFMARAYVTGSPLKFLWSYNTGPMSLSLLIFIFLVGFEHGVVFVITMIVGGCLLQFCVPLLEQPWITDAQLSAYYVRVLPSSP
jgi:hypothetical protein